MKNPSQHEKESERVINVIIADDHSLYKAAIKNVLSSKKDVNIIAQADNGSHLLDLLKTIHPDVILLDIQMPIMDGIAALPEVKKLYPAIKIIMLSMLDDQNTRKKLMGLGANSYLSKTSDSQIIYEAIKTCYEKEIYFDSSISNGLPDKLKQEIPSVLKFQKEDVILSVEEITVLGLICDEKTNREIADAIDLSVPAIEAMKDVLKIKTGAKSTAGLIMFAIKNNLPDPIAS